MLQSTDSNHLPLSSQLQLALPRWWCLVALMMLANLGEVAAAEDAPSAERSEASWSQEVWNEALVGNTDRCLSLLPQAPEEATSANPALALALQLYKKNQSLAEAEVLADRAWAWDRAPPARGRRWARLAGRNGHPLPAT